MDLIFRDRPPPPKFFSIIGRSIYAETQWCKLVKNLYIDGQREIFNFCAFNISVKLHDFVCRPRRIAVEILIKINKNIYPRTYDFPYILRLIKPTVKGPKQCSFPNILGITILAAMYLSKWFNRAMFGSYSAEFLHNRT